MIKSYGKINLHLGVLKKLNSKVHEIESVVMFCNIYDQIYIKISKFKKHQIIFKGQFAKGIVKKNTVLLLLNIIDKMNLLKGKKLQVIITKNIPLKSGMGGGSMNAAYILNYLNKKFKFNLSKNRVKSICEQIGSDVIFGINRSPKLLIRGKKLFDIKQSIKFHLVVFKPNFGCKTQRIYNNFKNFSKPILERKSFKLNNFEKYRNDLEIPAFKLYPSLLKIKIDMEEVPNILFARMTGSGSTIIGYFLRKKDAIYGTKYLKKKYNKCWCIISKTI